MDQVVTKLLALLAMGLVLIACEGQPQPASPWQQAPTSWQPQPQLQVEDIRLLPQALANAGGDRVIVSERNGVVLLNAEGKVLAQHPGSYERLDLRVIDEQLMLATVDRDRQQVMLLAAAARAELPQTPEWGEPMWLPALAYDIEGLCLYRQQQHLFVFILGSEGQGSQFLVASDGQWLSAAMAVRDIGVPPGAEYCQVDDQQGLLYISEPGAGLWQYPAGSEAELERTPLAMQQPFGVLQQGADAVSVVGNRILLLDADAQQLHLLPMSAADSEPVVVNIEQGSVELVSGRQGDTGIELLLLAENNQLLQAVLNHRVDPVNPAVTPMAEVRPVVETVPVDKRGDAADDPAIWIHPKDTSRSRVLGTNKQEGLLVYDLQGQLVQRFPSGRLNNVDVRYGPEFDVAMASNRDHNSVTVYRINHADGLLTYAGEVATELTDIYGFCLYQPEPGDWHAFANDKDGSYLQIQVTFSAGQPQGQVLRRFKLDSQPEGCVADDDAHRLFVGEESLGVWLLDARADQPTDRSMVIPVGGPLHADVEGLALYQPADSENHYLVISSQGNDSYVVVDSSAPYSVRGVFRVGMHPAAGIDGASETDGLEVTAVNLGAPFEQGMLVVQDGRNRLPEANQNFKLVPWSSIQKVLD
jgi:3-phytase